jgi:glycosyltransferase involved in cell wall biosynthesis
VLIGIDASRAGRALRTGTEGYSLHLITALLQRPGPRRYRLYFDRAPSVDFPRSPRAEIRIIPFPRFWTHLRLSAELVRRRPDVLFVPAHVIPFICPAPAVATIHDVGYLWHRSAYTPLAWILLHIGTLQNARVARRIVVDSQATARDLIAHFGVASSRLRVAYLGAPPVREVPPDPEVATRYGLPPRYLLFVGTLQPRKNLGRLLDALARLPRSTGSSVSLVLAGRPGVGSARLRALAEALGVADRVVWLSYVAEEHKPSLYAGAQALVFPSLYEGFGLPVLEAMAWGTPVIASTSSSLPEVVGEAGLLVDPYDVDALARAMARVLEDGALREQLIAAGRERAAQFTWDRCAAEVEEALDEAARG